MAKLPADLPENWTQGQIVSPNGTEVGLTEKHGYNYLAKQINDTQDEVNAINTTLEGVAKETTTQEIDNKIGETGDTGGSSTEGSLMSKLNEILNRLGISITGSTVQGVLEELLTNSADIVAALPLINSTIDSSNPVSLDVLMTQLLYKTTFEYSTPGTYSLLIPANVNQIKVTACGGGGGGAYADLKSSSGAGGGGGAAAIIEQTYSVTPQATLTITVGSGGAAGTSNSKNGSDGGATIINSLVTLAGGRGGEIGEETPSSSSYSGNGGTAGGTGGGNGGRGWFSPYGDSANYTAESGSAGVLGAGGTGGSTGTYNQNSGRATIAGGGGGGSLGNGGTGGGNWNNGGTGTRGGGGGGGGYLNKSGSGVTSNPGAGGNGYAKIELIINA